MAQELETDFSQVVPGAADMRDDFLGEVLKRTNAAGLGIQLAVAKPKKRDDRYVLRGTLAIGNWRGKDPYTLEVYADPLGNMLQTGWQLSSFAVGGVAGGSTFGQFHSLQKARRQANPDVQRQLSGIVQGFHQGVFLPTLQLLVDAMGSVGGQSGGFLGA